MDLLKLVRLKFSGLKKNVTKRFIFDICNELS